IANMLGRHFPPALVLVGGRGSEARPLFVSLAAHREGIFGVSWAVVQPGQQVAVHIRQGNHHTVTFDYRQRGEPGAHAPARHPSVCWRRQRSEELPPPVTERSRGFSQSSSTTPVPCRSSSTSPGP